MGLSFETIGPSQDLLLFHTLKSPGTPFGWGDVLG